uniref:S-layer domain-containing protein n=2 Tax=environmental samples TaxID=651140 RepID=A0A075GI91_9ARCH|nr:hypothetical protein [uncultured marine thaumarchaeote KM3_14_C04]AIF06045.1 hypothetical protein [uncultured marine thaumarchaeote KM3_18_F10]
MDPVKLAFLLVLVCSIPVFHAYGQLDDKPPQGILRSGIVGVKLLDAYFGTSTEKMEVGPGDKNVPFTVEFANIGTTDIVGIKGKMSVPTYFHSPQGINYPILADSNAKATLGSNFHLTFYLDISEGALIKTYPGSVEIDYSRLKSSGVRQNSFQFTFSLPGESIVNLKSLTPVITSITNNDVTLEISNSGSATLSNVDIVLQNTDTSVSSASVSTTNVEKVIFDQNHWKVGSVEPNSAKTFSFNVFVPESLKNEPLRIPMKITYFNAHGDKQSLTRVADLYINGLVKPSIYGVKVIELSGKKTLIGEILNEGNADGLFGFVKLQPRGDSNIRESSQYIDEIEPDSPVPFNIPIESNGPLSFGEHDVRVLVSYKDAVRDEHTITYDTTITINPFADNTDYGSIIGGLIFLAFVIAIGYKLYSKGKIPFIKKGKTPYVSEKTES